MDVVGGTEPSSASEQRRRAVLVRSREDLCSTMCELIVPAVHLGLGGDVVKLLQQGVVHGHLAVPAATLDSELYQVNDDASERFQVFI